MRYPTPRPGSRHPRRTATALLLAAALLPALVSGCSVGGSGGSGGEQRVAPGAARTTVSTSADGVSLSMTARNVDLQITAATVRIASSGAAYVQLTVHNSGTVAEHLALVSTPAGGQGTLGGRAVGTAGYPSGSLSTAGVRLDSGSSTLFGAPSGTANPSITLRPEPGLKVGGTEPVMLMFGIAGLVRLDLPVRAA